jgi:hypothetical protein
MGPATATTTSTSEQRQQRHQGLGDAKLQQGMQLPCVEDHPAPR